MEQLIPIVGKLQDVLGALGQTTTLNLPQIVVIGGQSSGKSSVLEGLVGKSFLPRGTGIVTRRPLILELINTSRSLSHLPDDEEEEEEEGKKLAEEELEWGEFLHVPGQRYANFNRIREEIVKDTERLTGHNRGISKEPLHLKIYSPTVLQLTLVDLPGIAKVAIGDQPMDIETQIRSMCLQYISNPNAIIVAVTAANTDLANSDGIQMAREVDPLGERTIGVLTKVDLMDPGTDATEILGNKLIPLRRGYIAVVNRGQLDIDRDMSIVDGHSKEQSFFIATTAYRSYQHRCGSYNLAKALNSILMHHIRDCLPELRSRIVAMLCDVQSELDTLGEPIADATRSTMGGALLGLLSKFATSFQDCIDGKGTSDDGLEMNELYGGARIAFIFNEVFVRSLMGIHPFDSLTDDEIRTTICNANGTRTALFVPEISFELLVKRQIRRLEQPGSQCVDLVFDELQRIASHCEPSEFTRFPILKDKMVDVVGKLLRRAVAPTQMMVSNLIQIELAYINTSHPDFIRGSAAVAQLMDKLASNHGSATRQDHNNTTPRHHHHNHLQDQSSSSNLDNNSDTLDAQQLPSNDDNFHQQDPSATTSDGGGNLMNFIFRGKPNNDSLNNSTNNQTNTKPLTYPPTIVQLPQIPDTMRCQTDLPTNREKIETEIIKSLIQSYFSIVTKNFIDLVPKTIMYFLVNHAKDSMQNQLVSELYSDTLIPELMSEADDVAQRRRTCSEMRDLLGKAMEIVNEVRDFNTFK